MRYLVLDTETTGMDPTVDRICEIAGVWREGDTVHLYSDLCCPGRTIPPEASAVHHLTAEDVQDADSPSDVMWRIVDEFGSLADACIVAHNADFDGSFISRLSPPVPEVPWICTYRCALHLWPDAPGHSNQVLRYWLGLRVENLPLDLAPHRALYDTLVTETILQRMLSEGQSLEELLRLTSAPAILTKIRFGKHRGTLWKNVDRGYLRWVLSQSDMDRDVLQTTRHHYG